MRGRRNLPSGKPNNEEISASVADAEAKTMRRWVDCEFYVCRLTVRVRANMGFVHTRPHVVVTLHLFLGPSIRNKWEQYNR